jgi:IgGFc binding protein/GDSL-like Lipase/Acylhydrolase family
MRRPTRSVHAMVRRGMRPSALAAMIAVAFACATTTADATVSPGPYNGPSSTVGTEFWFAFGANVSEETNYVDISGTTATTATVAVPALGFSEDVSVTPGQTTNVALPRPSDLTTPDGVEGLGVHVTAAAPVTVYGLEDTNASTDGFTALPVTAIGTNYYALGYEALAGQPPEAAPSDFQIVGTRNGTTVTITPAASTANRVQGVPYTVTLNTGETYQLIGSNGADLTGTHITANAPVSVLAGAECANIPSLSYVYCNYVAEQMPPTPEWGKDFLTEPLATRTLGDTFRVLAGQAGTTVTLNGTDVASLEAGQFYQTQLTEASTITTSHPALVAQFSDSTTFDNDALADPSEVLVPPSEQFLHSYTYATPVDSRFTNYVNVVAPNSDIGLLLLDGSPVPNASFTQIQSSGFSGAQLSVGIGTHTLTGSQPFGLTAYGFGPYDAYSYPGGYAATSSGTSNPTVNRYVALGDSYSAGEGAYDMYGNPAFYPNTNISGGSAPNTCHRSMHAYPELVRRDPRVAAQAFTFAACSGAKLPDFVASLPRAAGTGNQGGQWGEPAQINRIASPGSADPSVSLVTFTISGNDFGFVNILGACVGGVGHAASTSSCSGEIARYKLIGTKILKSGATVHMDSNGDGNYTLCSGTCTGSGYVHIPGFRDLLTMIHGRAPNARIIVVGYPQLFPEKLVSNCNVGWNGLAHYSITPANDSLVVAGEEYADNLIREIVQQAAAQGLNVRFADPRAGFEGHDVCQIHDKTGQPQTHAWINELIFSSLTNYTVESFHPNAAGQKAYAELVAGCYAKATSCGWDPFH